MKRTLVFMRWIWLQAWLAAPKQTAVVILVNLALSAAPALKVLAIAAYVRSLSQATTFSETAPSLGVLIALIAFTGPLAYIELNLKVRAIDLLKLRLVSEMTATIAGLTPQEMATPEVATRIEKAHAAGQDELPERFGYMVTLFRDVIAVIAVIVSIASMSVTAAVLVFLSLFPPLFAAHRSSQILHGLWESTGDLYWRARYLHQNLVSGGTARELNSLGAAPRVGSMVESVYRRITDERKATYRPILTVRLLTGLVNSVILAGALIALTTDVDYGPVAVGGVYGIIAAMDCMGVLGSNLTSTIEAGEAYGRYAALQELRRPAVAHTPQPRIAALQVRDLAFSYPDASRPAVSGLSLDIEQGQIVAVVGVNGAGKTTAVNCIVGSLQQDTGQVLIDGVDRSTLGTASWGSHFGLLTQEFGRYEMTVRESLLLGSMDRTVTDDDLWAALEGANAAELVRSFPDGLDQHLGSQWAGGTGVSGGQWQRISLARIMLRNAPIWILDEPTSSIDAESEQEIFKALQRDRADRVTIVVSHRAWTLKNMDEIIVLDQGVVVERGTYTDLLAHNGRFAAIFAEQV